LFIKQLHVGGREAVEGILLARGFWSYIRLPGRVARKALAVQFFGPLRFAPGRLSAISEQLETAIGTTQVWFEGKMAIAMDEFRNTF
jgi:hypothetical protein